ncbi:amylo-alpha-1,6-glucosidase [Microtetraspora niveoalba]|uniref:amylo-alpha-1,6-glucosidase n=1 Tax=Microtetraspora niveoalba TaxID=46175 RepID=UPI00082CE7DE|nr:glycogen debranching N-terminal domain-containing protein [Microtetraspora niveoalba]
MNGWTFEGQPTALGGATVTVVEGSSFCVSGRNGDITPGGAQGVYHADTRLLSRWELRVDEAPIEPLQVLPAEPYHSIFMSRARPRPGRAESTLLVFRDRYVGGGLREDIALRNLSDEPAGCVVELHVGSDVADLFEVKTDRIRHVADIDVTANPDGLRIYSVSRARGVSVVSSGVLAVPGLLTYRIVVPARGEWQTTVHVNPVIEGEETLAWFSHLDLAEPAARRADWEQQSPIVVTSDPGLTDALRCSKQDLGSLRLFEADYPDDPPSIAAGAPWFMTLFGRDSLLASWFALTVDRSLALGTLRRLARLQGTRVDPLTEEEPGKILHELRFGVATAASPLGGNAYYGSVDATPLFVMLLGELRRWGLHREAVDELLPPADAALNWIEEYGGPEDLLWYCRKTDQGLIHQGWKDSFDGVNFADGTLARPPIALAEVQGYAYSAYIARGHFAHEAGDRETEKHCAARAARIRKAFNERFWVPEQEYFAIGLDRSGFQIDSVASNIGHCLWTGIVDQDKAEAVVRRLMSETMFSGFGIRTLATDMAAYNPMSYHNGSVWPHDNAIVAGGLMRYGFVAEAQRVITANMDAAKAFGGRLPELFCGFERAEFPVPVPYPTSCSPQAWAAAAPIHMMRTLLRFDPWVPYRKLWIDPVLPEGFGTLSISGLRLAGTRVGIDVKDGETEISGLPDDIEILHRARPPISSMVTDGR